MHKVIGCSTVAAKDNGLDPLIYVVFYLHFATLPIELLIDL